MKLMLSAFCLMLTSVALADKYVDPYGGSPYDIGTAWLSDPKDIIVPTACDVLTKQLDSTKVIDFNTDEIYSTPGMNGVDANCVSHKGQIAISKQQDGYSFKVISWPLPKFENKYCKSNYESSVDLAGASGTISLKLMALTVKDGFYYYPQHYQYCKMEVDTLSPGLGLFLSKIEWTQYASPFPLGNWDVTGFGNRGGRAESEVCSIYSNGRYQGYGVANNCHVHWKFK
jgi:hypothetical protein